MPVAAVPAPQYIDFDANVYPLIGRDKVLVNDVDSTAIDIQTANMLVAAGESIVLEDLSPYYVTVPALITIQGGSWDTLPAQTYNIIYDMFVFQAAIQIIGSFIAKNTDEADRTLSYFQKNFASEYNKRLNRIIETLPNGAYKYQLIGLKPLTNGIPRTPKRYARSGSLGANTYVDNQLTNPALNFDVFWGSRFRGGGQ